ncbi:hypothetical protein F4806DRAFT_481422 [Annulohypoxylon nitens]|nr:hypothetical protein F4806DRAFT_481422 [Annulohypoxylon nitens]
MELPPVPIDVFGQPLNLVFEDGVSLSHISTELCLRLACIHTGRLPAFLFSKALQFRITRYPRKCVVPIVIPYLGSTNLSVTQIPTLSEHIPSEIAILVYPVLPKEEYEKLLRERILVIDEDDCLSYIALSSSWQNDIRQRCQNQHLIAATWRISIMLGVNLPDFYSHPLQANIAANCRETLGTTVLPHVRICELPNWILNETDLSSLLCFARLSFYSLLCGMMPLTVSGCHPSCSFTGFHNLMHKVSQLLESGIKPPPFNRSIFAEPLELLQENQHWEEAAIFCFSAAWPNFNSFSRALVQGILVKWVPISSHKWNWDMRKAMIDESLWDKPLHIRQDWAAPSSAAIASFFININKPVNAAHILEDVLEVEDVRLLNTPLAAELIHCLDYSSKGRAIRFGEKALTRYMDNAGKLACEPLVRIALADVYMGMGNYTRATELLTPVLHNSKASTHLKILVSLRLNKSNRRTKAELDIAIIGAESSLRFVFLHLETATHPLKIVCLSELIATLIELRISGESEPFSWVLPYHAWRIFDEDESIKLDWRYESLQSLLKIPREPTISIIGTPPMGKNSTFHEEFHNWIQHARLSGITYFKAIRRVDFIPESQVIAFFEDAKHFEYLTTLSHFNGTSFSRNFLKITSILLILKRYDLISGLASRLQPEDPQLPYLAKPDWISSDDKELWEKFYQLQWRFCVKPLKLNGDEMIMRPGRMLPVKHTRYLGAGSCAVLDKIVVHKRYVEDGSGAKSNNSTVMTLKAFVSPHARQYYEAELQAFKQLAHGVDRPESIIKFFGGVQIGDTYALLLEYADMGDLDFYMRQVSPPTSKSDMNRLWSQVLQLGNALAYQHSMPYRIKDIKLYRWNQDIKPKNILVTNSPVGIIFKLASIGLSHFETVGSCLGDISDWDSFGTYMYGAPESTTWKTSTKGVNWKTGQIADVWSLGCVYSEVAVWSAFGYPALEKYRYSREQEVNSIPGFTHPGCFHNGHDTLLTVASFHSMILVESKFNEPGKVLPLIRHMLLRKENRITSLLVAEMSRNIFDNDISYKNRFLEMKCRLGISLNEMKDLRHLLNFPELSERVISKTSLEVAQHAGYLSIRDGNYSQEWDKPGDSEALDLAIERARETLVCSSDRAEFQARKLEDLTTLIHRKINILIEKNQPESALDLARTVVNEIPKDFVIRPQLLSILGKQLCGRYEHKHEEVDLIEAVRYYEEAVTAAHRVLNRETYILIAEGLQQALELRYQLHQRSEDLNRMISIIETAIPKYDPKRMAIEKCRLAQYLGHRYSRHEAKLEDLERAIELGMSFNDIPLADYSSRLKGLDNLINILGLRYEYDDQQAMFDEVMRLLQSETMARGESFFYIYQLAMLHMKQYEYSGDIIDLTEAIESYKKAISDSGLKCKGTGLWLSNLGVFLLRRYMRIEEGGILDEAISKRYEAISIKGPRDLGKRFLLWAQMNLAECFAQKYCYTGNQKHLVLAVDLGQKVVAATSPNDSSRHTFLKYIEAWLR